MTLNPRHPGIFISAGSPVRPQPDGIPFYWHRTYPAVASLERMNVALPPRFGEAYSAYSAYSAVFSATKSPSFYRLRDLVRKIRLTRTFLTDKTGDTTSADKRPALTLGCQQPAEPKAASKPPSHACHAHFSYFPRTPALKKASAAQRNAEKSPTRSISSLSSHFLAISREAREASPRSAGQRNAEKSPLRELRALRAHTLAISREPPAPSRGPLPANNLDAPHRGRYC
jgi:hypothetical protein